MTTSDPSHPHAGAPAARAVRVLDRYELLAPLADDGISRTWSARPREQPMLELEELDPYVAQVSEFRDAFLREAGVLRRAAHPALLTYTAATIADGAVFGVRAARNATTLAALLARGGPLPAPVATRVAIAILEALAPIAALSSPGRPACHGDVTPSSVLVTESGEVLLIATCLGVAAARPDAPAPGRAHARIGYKAPEQVRPSTGVARTIDARADAFAVGAILWEAIVGRPPFEAASAAAVVGRILGEVAAPPDAARALPGLQAALARALHPDAGARATPDLLLGSLRLVPGLASPEEAARELAARARGPLARDPHAVAAEEIELELDAELEPDPAEAAAVTPAPAPTPPSDAAAPPHAGRAARERPPAPPSEAQYVSMSAVAPAPRVVTNEPQASVVIDVPTSGANEAEVLASRARRRLATMKIDRSAIPGLLAMDASLRNAALDQVQAAAGNTAVSAFAPAATSPVVSPIGAAAGAPYPALAPPVDPTPAARASARTLAVVVVTFAAVAILGALAAFLILSRNSEGTTGAPSPEAAGAASP